MSQLTHWRTAAGESIPVKERALGQLLHKDFARAIKEARAEHRKTEGGGGACLGLGYHRVVYKTHNPALVAKVTNGGNDDLEFHNVVEWKLWEALEHKPIGKWLAPCWHITRCGSVLLQARCQPLTRDQLPRRVPTVLAVDDCKRSQWGLFEGRPVCFDYGILHSHINTNLTLQLPKWLD